MVVSLAFTKVFGWGFDVCILMEDGKVCIVCRWEVVEDGEDLLMGFYLFI